MRRFLRDNGLSVALFVLFAVCLAGQALAGWRTLLEELRVHAMPPIGFAEYLATGHFISAVFENWESEFLQMAAYVLLTVFLVQKGSSESKKPGEANPEDEPPHQHRDDPDAPWPVHRGGLVLKLYSHSLSIALVALFLASFWLHLAGSTKRMNEEALEHRQPTRTMAETLVDAGVLVREPAELAERVPVDRRAAGARHLPARARVARIETRRGPACHDGTLSAAPERRAAQGHGTGQPAPMGRRGA